MYIQVEIQYIRLSTSTNNNKNHKKTSTEIDNKIKSDDFVTWNMDLFGLRYLMISNTYWKLSS